MFDASKERHVGDEITVNRDGENHQGVFKINDHSATPYLVYFDKGIYGVGKIWFYPNGCSNIGNRIRLLDFTPGDLLRIYLNKHRGI